MTVNDSLVIPRFKSAEPTPQGYWSTSEVAHWVGCSYRQLDYWCRRGWIPGQPVEKVGSGFRRVWTLEQIQRAWSLRQATILRDAPLDEIAEHLHVPPLPEQPPTPAVARALRFEAIAGR